MRLVVLHPAANHRVNRWPVSHCAALCDTLARRPDVLIALTGHAKNAALCRSIRNTLEDPERCMNLSGKLSLKELGALLERADAFVTGDTGPMHIASAVGTPLISLFGAADPDRTKPLAASSSVLSDRSLPCAPCHARKCRYGREARCMQLLLPRTVIAAVDDLLRQSSQTGSLQTEAV
jgi:ADP-heptose:LPS heptosyltransferase